MISPEILESWKVNTFAKETQFQAAAYQMLNNEFWQFRGKVWHVRNEGGHYHTSEGVIPGNPDLHIKWQGVLFTNELKLEKYRDTKNGGLSPAQQKLHKLWNEDCPEIPVWVSYTLYDVYMWGMWILERNFKVGRDV